MSECPGCHTGARHVGVVVGWRPTDPWLILHECRKTPACQGQWTEEVLFPGPILERVRYSVAAYSERNRPVFIKEDAACICKDWVGFTDCPVHGDPEVAHGQD